MQDDREDKAGVQDADNCLCRLKDIVKWYPPDRLVLDQFSLEIGRGERVAGIFFRVAPFVEELDLELLRGNVFGEHPQVAQRPVGVVVLPVGVTVFEEDVAVLVEHVVASAASGRGVEVEDHLAARPLQHAVEQPPQVAFGAFVGDCQSVDLERADAVLVVETDE